jgi:hypothetical protein
MINEVAWDYLEYLKGLSSLKLKRIKQKKKRVNDIMPSW